MGALTVVLWVMVALALAPVLMVAVGGTLLAVDEAKALRGLARVFQRAK